MTSDDKVNWDLTNIAYSPASERQNQLDSKYAGRFKVDNRFNFDNYSAVWDSQENKLLHLHRGTTNWDDAATDAYLAVGQLGQTSRYKTTEERVRQVHNAYSNVRHAHLGHSLGGTLADTFARQHGDASVAYNMGSTPLSGRLHFDSHNRHIRIGTDFVSSFQRGNGTETKEKAPNRLDQLLSRVRHPFGSRSDIGFALGAAHRAQRAYSSHFLHNFFKW
jgi:hypothetical protein